MSDFPTQASHLKSKKQELVELLLKKKGINTRRVQTIPQRTQTSPCPLSFAQQRLWFLNQLEPGNPFYNRPSALRLTGQLNAAVLEQSFQEIVRRHEALRTTFITVEGQALQAIAPNVTLTMPIVDLQQFPETQQEAEVRRLATQEAWRPFDLSQGPLLRVSLLRLTQEDHVLLFTMHHIVSDGWSIGVLVREVATLYEAFANGKPSPLPELPIQYADFAVWQRQWLQGEVLEAQLSYWKQQLGGASSLLELPSDRPRPAIQSYKGATKSLVLSKPLTDALKALSQQEGATLFMTLLAAFKTLLYRYTGEQDIFVGSPIANRNRFELEPLIGFFVNTLVLRTHLSGNPSFRELLRRVREVALGAYAHQDLPFEQLVEELQPERHLNRNPLFDVMFILQNAPTEVLKLPNLTLSTLSRESKTANFDLTLSMTETEQGLVGSLEYSTDLFDGTTIERMLGHFQVLLEGIVAYPDQCLSDLPILTKAERQQLLVDWNHTQTAYEQHLCIHQLFEEQVERSPNAVAVIFGQEQLTYRELNQRANQLAHYLQNQGVAPEVLVGLCMERSVEMVVGLLGILKAGGAYLPLDPAYPQERLAFMLAEAQVSVLLTQEQLVAELPTHNAQVICLDNANWDLNAYPEEENPITGVTKDNLAYVIYTSGSTGQSKGVMVQHRSLVNAYFAWEEAYQLRTTVTSHLQMASFSFDVFSGDLVRALCSGGKLVLCPRDLLLDPPKLYELMLKEKVDCAEFVPTVLRNLIQYLEESQQRLDFMQLLICGSDSWYVQEYEKFQHLCGAKTRLINSFGLTEATIDSSYFETATVDLPVEQLVPIGRPFANTQIYILDSHLQPVPMGVKGELYIGGTGLARGYLHRPDLTAEKFIPNFFSNKAGARLYKTGDLGRYLPDGNIELLGRSDYQVKIRGFRIELGEIEAVLGQNPGVRETVVMVREDTPNNPHLVAYVVPNVETRAAQEYSATLISDLQRFLQERLPNYMIPSAFVILESFPLTPNGKINRRALPAPENNRPELESSFVAPYTAIQKTLVSIWTNVLNIQRVGIHDNFFNLGGHSLLTTRLIVKIREAFQVDLPLRILFESPTVASLAESLERILQGKPLTTLTKETIVKLNAEAVLDSTIFPETSFVEPITEPACIFLTGATGFLGAFLLYELLQQTQADIYCLVRSPNVEEGKKKLKTSLESYLLWHESFNARIIPVIGDLSEPILGFSEAQFQEMAHKIDVIYHNGAWVHHIYPYSVLKAANVLGTQEVLRLACKIKTKPVHFISTTSVFSASGISGVKEVREEDSIDDFQLPGNGYVQTKWVGEKLIKAASNRGLPICIYRLGRVSGHSETGVFNTNDFLYRLIIGCIQLGSAPDRDIMEDIMPVDYTSRAIAYLSRQKVSLGKAFHLVNPHLLHSKILLNVIHSFGYPLQQISYDQWRAKLMNIASSSPEHPLYPLVPFFSARKSQEKTSNSAVLQFDCRNTLDGLVGTSILCPAIDEQLLSTYVSYLMKSGFLTPPQSAIEVQPSH